jgi:hypothetical protein
MEESLQKRENELYTAGIRSEPLGRDTDTDTYGEKIVILGGRERIWKSTGARSSSLFPSPLVLLTENLFHKT